MLYVIIIFNLVFGLISYTHKQISVLHPTVTIEMTRQDCRAKSKIQTCHRLSVFVDETENIFRFASPLIIRDNVLFQKCAQYQVGFVTSFLIKSLYK